MTKAETDVFARQLQQNTQKKKRSRVWRGLGLITLACFAGGVGYATLTPHGRTTVPMIWGGIKTISEVKANPDLIFDSVGSDHVNILLIGRDVNWKPAKVYDPKAKMWRPYRVHDKETQARSDTMIVVSLDKKRKAIHMVSFPRDAIVRLADNEFGVRRTKLNAAHAYGGPELLKKTMHDELGITIHRYAVIKFEGFKKLIDQVGGVYVNVDGALKRRHGKLYRGNLDYDDNWGNLHIHLKPGYQLLDGQAAHNYVRFRMDLEGDPGRIRRQQAVMRALGKQIMHAGITQIPGLIHEARRQFETDMDDSEIGAAANFARNIGDASKIQPMTLFGVYGTRGSLILNKPKNEKLLAYIFGPTFNRHRFLERSPWARGDEIGETNNSNPAAIAVLRAAGIIKGDKDEPTAPGLDAPVVAEPDTVSADASAESSSERHSRLAAVNDDIAPRAERRRSREDRSSEEGRASRRHRSRSTLQVEGTTPARRGAASNEDTRDNDRSEAASSHASSQARENNDTAEASPLPQPETSSAPAASDNAGGASSPVPEPE
ncbi:MAG: LCP family protein [Armatimonadota bacterium]|nr:LCP family protein [Armatimonadota bacterium]